MTESVQTELEKIILSLNLDEKSFADRLGIGYSTLRGWMNYPLPPPIKRPQQAIIRSMCMRKNVDIRRITWLN